MVGAGLRDPAPILELAQASLPSTSLLRKCPVAVPIAEDGALVTVPAQNTSRWIQSLELCMRFVAAGHLLPDTIRTSAGKLIPPGV